MNLAAFFLLNLTGRLEDATNPHLMAAGEAAERLAVRAGKSGEVQGFSDWGTTPLHTLIMQLKHEADHPDGLFGGNRSQLFELLMEVWVKDRDKQDLLMATGRDRDGWLALAN